jgi:TPR repeat protein
MLASSRPARFKRYGFTAALLAGLTAAAAGFSARAQESLMAGDQDLALQETGLETEAEAGMTAAPAGAATVAVRFEPPHIEVAKICDPSTPEDQLLAEWAAWDGKALPDRPAGQIRTDLRRLMEADAIRWFDTITKAYALMPAVDASFDANDALLARVTLLIAAGRLKELTDQRLVEQLLQTDIGASPRLQNILSDLLIQGTGIKADRQRGMELLVAAGYGGNADALLKIVALQQKGTEVPGWDVPPDLAVTMAFGALVGKLDPMICERVARIAREYTGGSIVTRDIGLAEKWYRFAADLGDGASAWKVAEMHLWSEDLVKSNEVLVTYLTKAAEAELPYAQVALGRLYEQGALVPRDLDRAERLFAQAAAYGDRAGLLRYALFLQARAKTDPAYQSRYREILAEFAKGDEAPGWVYIALGDAALADQGRWAGEAEAVAYYTRAEQMGEFDASKRLTPIRFRYATTPEAFYEVVDEVINTVHGGGEIDPMNGLRNAFACRAPNAPQREEADYWNAVSAATGTKTANFSPTELLDLVTNPDPATIATLQSQAMYGRPVALAQYLALLQRSGAPQAQIEFWEAYADRFARVNASRGRLELKFAEIGQNLSDPTAYLRAAVAEGDVEAGIELAEHLMAQDPVANRAAALTLVEPGAALGIGRALRLLPALDPESFPDLAAVAAEYAGQIDARGDFDALVLALPHLADPEQRADYLRRAETITDCSFNQVITLTDALGQIGDAPGFDKWMTIADYVSEADGWRMVEMGDLLRKYRGDAMLVAQLDLYQRGYEAGNITAIHRLLDIVARTGGPEFDPARAADLFVALVQQSDPDDIPRALSRLSQTEPQIQTAALARLDVPELYRVAAEAGNPAGMREHGKILMATAATAEDLALGADWLEKAADKGDVAAMLTYADALAFGLGVPPSRPDALIWLQKAADLGNEDAQSKLRTMALMPEVTQ